MSDTDTENETAEETMRRTLRWIASRFCHGRACMLNDKNGPAERCEHRAAREVLELLEGRKSK